MYHLLQVSSSTPPSHARTLVSVMLLALPFADSGRRADALGAPRLVWIFIAAVVTRPPPGLRRRQFAAIRRFQRTPFSTC